MFTPPQVSVGQVVLWRFDRTGPASPAIVTAVGEKTIAVSVHVASIKDHLTKSGVRFVGDPDLDHMQNDNGTWDFTDLDKRVMALLRDFEAPASDPKKPAK